MEKFITAEGKKKMLLKLIALNYQQVLVLKVEFTSNEIQNKLHFMKIPVCFSALLANRHKTINFMLVFIQSRVQKMPHILQFRPRISAMSALRFFYFMAAFFQVVCQNVIDLV